MSNLLSLPAKRCLTASGLLIHQNKVLLIKHKKLKFWMAPGGHLEPNELPHQAAEREFWEETGIKVKTIDPFVSPKLVNSEYIPNPLKTNLHWVSQENYQARLKSSNPDQRVKTQLWPKGCEQHCGFVYLVKELSDLTYKQNVEETDGIAWFSEADLSSLDTIDEVRYEIQLAFSLLAHAKELNKLLRT